MKKIFFALIFISLLFILFIAVSKEEMKSCNQKTAKIKYYKDFDRYNLKGIDELNEKQLRFPYLEVFELNGKIKTLVIHNGEDNHKVREFREYGTEMVECSYYLEGDDTGWDYYLSYFKDGKILTYMYWKKNLTDTTNHLRYLSIEEHGTQRAFSYDYETTLVVPDPNLHFHQSPKGMFATYYDEFKVKNDTLSTWGKRNNHTKEGDKIVYDNTCYKLNGLSYFWWIHNYVATTRIECD